MKFYLYTLLVLAPAVSCNKPAVGGCPGEGPVEDCSKACGCRTLGRCANVDGRCTPTTDEHCAKSRSCEASGLCHVEGNRCVAKIQQDCDNAKICQAQECRPEGGVCKPLGLKTASSSAP